MVSELGAQIQRWKYERQVVQSRIRAVDVYGEGGRLLGADTICRTLILNSAHELVQWNRHDFQTHDADRGDTIRFGKQRYWPPAFRIFLRKSKS